MKTKSLLRGLGFAALLAVTSSAFAQVVLPTGATITPNAAPGSVFAPLTTSLPDFSSYTPDGAETTAISPDGKTLLILTSGLQPDGRFERQLHRSRFWRIRFCI